MATDRDENPYGGGGLGTGGKFRKRPFRRSQATPYDRPPIALRNTGSNGWFSKIVDPAQRIITTSAHRLFSSVFRKRLPAPPPPLAPSQDANEDLRNKDDEASVADPSVVHGATHLGNSPSKKSDVCGVTELEQILKQKTFTRSEIDRLTALLHSRTIDIPSKEEAINSELVPSTAVVSHGRREEFLDTPAQEDGIGSHLVSTPVLDEDIASPAEIAKAYMGSRSSKVSPSVLRSRTPMFREDSTMLSRQPFPSKSPIMSLVPRSAGRADVAENGFMTPRTRGRSAIYTMARTPYSRVPATSTMKGIGSSVDNYGGPSSSPLQSPWDQGRILGSSQGALKRRSSVLDNDIGSVGPIRKTRQKPNLLSSKGLSLPASGQPISIAGTEFGSGSAQHLQSSNAEHLSSSVWRPGMSGEPIDSFSRMSKENGDNSMPSTSIPPVPSKSREMASKILEQIDKLTPPKEKSSELKLLRVRDKSPTKLSPSMLRGPALRSLEDVDSSKFLENTQDKNRSNGSHEISFPNAQYLKYQTQDKAEESCAVKSLVHVDRSTTVVNGVGSIIPTKDIVNSIGIPASSVVSTIFHPQKKRAFQMSAHEDYVDLDDEGYSNGAATAPSAEGRKKGDDSLTERKITATEEKTPFKPQLFSEVKPPVSFAIDKKSDLGASDNILEKSTSFTFTFPTGSSTSTNAQAINFKKALSSEINAEESNAAAPIFSFGEKVISQKETSAAASISSFGDKAASLNEKNAPRNLTFEDNTIASNEPTAVSSIFNFGGKVASVETNTVTENGNKFPPAQFKFAASTPVVGEAGVKHPSLIHKPERFGSSLISGSECGFLDEESISVKADTNNNSNSGYTSRTPESTLPSSVSASTSILNIPSFSLPNSNASTNNGPDPSFFSSFIPTSPSNNTSQIASSNPSLAVATNSSETAADTASATTLTTSTTISGLTAIAPKTSFPAASIFKFGSSTSVSPVSAVTETESVEVKTKQETNFGNLGNNPFGGASILISSTGSNVFGFGATANASTASKESQGTLFGAGSTPVFGSQATAAGSGSAPLTQSTPIQFASSLPAPSFGLAGNAASSGSSLFGSSTPATKLFNSGSMFGLASSTSPTQDNSLSTSSGPSSSLFGSTWQPSKTPIFGSTPSSSPTPTGFSFGSTSSVAATSAGPVFGTTSAASSSTFSFASSPAARSQQPVFGNSNSAFSFGSATPGNSDQMNMEDSMAEDTVQTSAPATPVFGQQPFSTPPSGFVFGSATPPPAANPFQFGSQQNLAASQNSPFQASGSLDFNSGAGGGGSFSLGAGGGDKANRKFVKVKHKLRKK